MGTYVRSGIGSFNGSSDSNGYGNIDDSALGEAL